MMNRLGIMFAMDATDGCKVKGKRTKIELN